MIKRMLAATVACSALLTTGSGAFAADKLAIYNFGGYINPEVLAKFTHDTGIDVSLDTYSSNEEMLAKIQAGAVGYDIVIPSVYMEDIMLKLGLLWKSDINKHRDFKNIDPISQRVKGDPNGEYCLPYAWGTTGIFYNKKITGEIKTWADFFAIPEKNRGKITLLDDMREVLAIGLIVNGKSVNSVDPADIKAASDYIISQKKKVTAFTYEVAPLITSGDIAAAHYYVGMNWVTKPIEGIEYVIPREGATMFQENICVLKTAPNKEAAKKFLEFYLKPEIAALNVKQQFNGTANMPARNLVPDIIKNDPNINVGPETLNRLQIFKDLGPALKLYDRAWNTIRTAQ
jgi:spermidine/putrescine transport system substrate-binding protein